MTPAAATLAKLTAAAKRTGLEDAFAQQLRAAGIDYRREVVFHPTRKWRMDFQVGFSAHPRLAVEVDGGTFTNGRHARGDGIAEDCVKYAEALCLGWRVLRVTGAQVKSGQALRWVERLLAT